MMGHVTTMSVELLKEYVHQPKPVLSVQITDENARKVALLVNGKLYAATEQAPTRIYFHCCNGRMKAEWGDWIIKDSKGFRAMSNKEFTETYEERK